MTIFPYFQSLFLAQSVLGYKIRREGEPHNCLTDAQAAMKLVLAKLANGFEHPIAIAGKDVILAPIINYLFIH